MQWWLCRGCIFFLLFLLIDCATAVVEVAMVVEIDVTTEMLEILAQTGINMVETDHVLTEFHL
jgi:hypothetical protein